MTITSVLFIAGVVTLMGILLALVGWRGRRVGDHPYCRRCGFDLFGRAEGSAVCSECGADLNRPRAVAVGVRRVRRKMTLAGVGVLVPASMALVIIGYGAASGVDWQLQKPVWWLAREAMSNDITTRVAALNSLLARLSAGSLSNEQMRDLVERGLTAQKDENQPWVTAWGDLIERERASGQVSAEEWETYVRQALIGTHTLRIRGRLRRGKPLPYRFDYSRARVGRSGTFWKVTRVAQWSINGEMVGDTSFDTMMLGDFVRRAGETRVLDAPNLWRDAAAGTQRGSMRVEALIQVHDPGRRRRAALRPPQQLGGLSQRRPWVRNAFPPAGESTAVTVELDFPCEFEVLPRHVPVVEPVIDPGLRQRVGRAIAVSRVRVMGVGLSVALTCDALPINMCCEVIVRSGNEEWPAGTWTYWGADSVPVRQSQFVTSGLLPRHDAMAMRKGDKVDIILRPSAEAAERSPDIVRYWGEEIVIRDVPVEN